MSKWATTPGLTASQIAADPALKAAFVPKWKPNTAYAAGEPVINPSGQTVTANAAFTSGTTYSASNWTVVSGGGSTTKRVTMPIGSDGSYGTINNLTSICQRLVVQIPASTKRWRLRVRNANPRTGTVNTGAITITTSYVGPPTIAADGTWDGSFSAAPVAAVAGGTTAADGSEWISDWVADPAAQFAADTRTALSWGFTCTNGTVLAAGAQRIALTYNGATAAAQVGSQTAPTGGVVPGVPILDARLEVECDTNLPVVVVVGDSTASGLIDDNALAPAIYGPWVTWPGQMSLARRCLVVNAALGSAKYSDFTTASSWAWQRFDLTTTRPDAAILACGINEASSSTTLATFMSTLQQTRTVLTGLGVQRLAYGTVMNSPVFKGGGLAAGVAIGATTLSTDVSYASGVSLSLDYGTANAENVTTVGTSTGAGPYTTTISAATTKAHAVGAVVASAGNEQRRQDYNNALRLGKAGPATLIEFADALRLADQIRFYGTGTLHHGAPAWAVLGRLASVD